MVRMVRLVFFCELGFSCEYGRWGFFCGRYVFEGLMGEEGVNVWVMDGDGWWWLGEWKGCLS